MMYADDTVILANSEGEIKIFLRHWNYTVSNGSYN